MARIGVTFEQVAAVADGLLGEGSVPTIRAVRERLGDKGSPNTIHMHLLAWRAARPVAPASAPQLPQALTDAILAELERASSLARSAIEGSLVRAHDEAAELSAAGAEMEKKIEELQGLVENVTRERDTQAGVIAKQQADLDAAMARIAREQEGAESARRAAAKAGVRLEIQEVRLSAQAEEIERLRSALSKAQQALIAAEQAAAVLTARLEARAAELQRAEARAEEMTRQAAAAAQELRQVQAERDEARQKTSEAGERAARLEGQVARAEDRVQAALRQAAAAEKAHEAALATAEQARDAAAHEAREARTAAAEAREETARLAGRISSLEAQAKAAPQAGGAA